jgi:hypothetical protein
LSRVLANDIYKGVEPADCRERWRHSRGHLPEPHGQVHRLEGFRGSYQRQVPPWPDVQSGYRQSVSSVSFLILVDTMLSNRWDGPSAGPRFSPRNAETPGVEFERVSTRHEFARHGVLLH